MPIFRRIVNSVRPFSGPFAGKTENIILAPHAARPAEKSGTYTRILLEGSDAAGAPPSVMNGFTVLTQ